MWSNVYTRSSNRSTQCDQCLKPVKSGEEALRCGGMCGSLLHRYCAGVSKSYYDKLAEAQSRLTCQYCELRLTKAINEQLNSEIEMLKTELAELKSVLQRGQIYRSTYNKLHPSCSKATKSKNKNGKHWQRQKRDSRWPAMTFTFKPWNPRPKVEIEGSRKVWGTMTSATETTVKTTLSKPTSITERKYKETHSGKVKWWFILKGSEDVMKRFESKWAKVPVGKLNLS